VQAERVFYSPLPFDHVCAPFLFLFDDVLSYQE